MNRSIILMVALGSATAAAPVHAQTAPGQSPAASVPDRPGVVYADRTRTTATVEAVDKDKRTVTLKVAAEYIDAVAIFVRKSDAPPAAGQTMKVTVAPKGEKPAGMVVDTIEVTARVEAIDPATRTVTLRGPDGGTKTSKVDERVQRLDEVKPGDEVVVRHTEALAIAVSR